MMTTKLSFALLPALWLCLTVSPMHAAAGKPEPHTITTLPLTLVNNAPLVQVQITKKVTATFVIDSCVNSCWISPKLATKLALPKHPFLWKGKPDLLNGKPVEFVKAPADMKLGKIEMPNAALMVLENRYTSKEHPVDGVLGTNFLAACAVLIDYPKQQLTITNDGKFSAADIRKVGMSNAMTLSLTPTGRGLYTLPATLTNGENKIQENLIVNTAITRTTIAAAAAEKLKLTPSNSVAALDPNNSAVGLLTTLEIGHAEWNNTLVEFIKSEKNQMPSLLGSATLASLRVLIDFASNKIFLKSEESAAARQ